MNTVIFIFLGIIGLMIISSIIRLYSKKLYWFSEVKGHVSKGNTPLANVVVTRTYDSDLFGNHTESTRTDETGNFHFPELTGNNPKWFVAPLMNGGLSQEIVIEHEGELYIAWQYRHSQVTVPNAELEGLPIDMICNLDNPEKETKVNGYKSIWGIGNLGLDYDKQYTQVQTQIHNNLDKLLNATKNTLTSDAYRQDLMKEINYDGVLNISSIEINNIRDLDISSFALTEQEGIVLFQQDFYVNTDLVLQTAHEGQLDYEAMAIVGYMWYDINKHELIKPDSQPAYVLPFYIQFAPLHTKILEQRIELSELHEGISTLLQQADEIAYIDGVEAIREAKKLLSIQIDSIQVNGHIDKRDFGKLAGLMVYGKADVMDKNIQTQVDFQYPVALEVSSIFNPPYAYIAKDYTHLWKKTNGSYQKHKTKQ